MTEPSIKVESLSRSFGRFEAVRDISFEAWPGQVIGLLGPNGAGKTTTIRVLATILEPTSGRFSIGGHPHTEKLGIRHAVGVLPESAGYPQHWTGEEYLRFHARLFGRSARQAKETARSLLRQVNLEERASSPVGTYSRGMRQRLGVARALINQPRVVFLDEPTLGLDPAGQRQMLSLIREIAEQRQTTVVLSTHFLDEVEEVCSDVLILNRGSVIASGTVAEIKRRAAPKAMKVQVGVAAKDRAIAVLEQAPGVAGVSSTDVESGWVVAAFEQAWLEQHPDGGMNEAVRCLVDASVPLVSLELEGGRLSDAFLALTAEEGT